MVLGSELATLQCVATYPNNRETTGPFDSNEFKTAENQEQVRNPQPSLSKNEKSEMLLTCVRPEARVHVKHVTNSSA